MASPYYTTATIVKDSLKAIDAGLTDTKILVYIVMCESIADSIMGLNFHTGFSAEKHGLVRRFCTNLTAIMCLAYDTTEYATTSMAALTADILWAQIEFDMLLLKSPDIVNYMKGL